MSRLFLLLGSNLGNKKQIFVAATSRLEEELGGIVLRSSIYATEPWGFHSDDFFWNQALVIETKKKPLEILESIHKIEKELGRIREKDRYISRLIDIDLLFYDNLTLQTSNLEIPHPRIAERKFVLEPLAEITPEFEHPVYRKTIKELLENCNDSLQVERLK